MIGENPDQKLQWLIIIHVRFVVILTSDLLVGKSGSHVATEAAQQGIHAAREVISRLQLIGMCVLLVPRQPWL